MTQTSNNPNTQVLGLLHGILEKTTEQNAILAALVSRQNAGPQQIQNWKTQNKDLSKRYGKASVVANTLMHGFMCEMIDVLEDLDTDEFEHNFQFMEFIDKYGPRVQQLNMLLQLLASLGTHA